MELRGKQARWIGNAGLLLLVAIGFAVMMPAAVSASARRHPDQPESRPFRGRRLSATG